MILLCEMVVIICAFFILGLDLFFPKLKKEVLSLCAGLSLLLALVLLIGWVPQSGATLGGRFIVDGVSWWFKLCFLCATLFTVMISSDLLCGKAAVKLSGFSSVGEFYVILLLTLVGAMFLVSATDLVTLYVSLELATIPLYLLVAWRRNDVLSAEAGLKYVILGALSSAFLLWGLSLLYGLTGTTDLHGIAMNLSSSAPTFLLALVTIVVAVGFKLTVVPFHLWAADVYQGAPLPVTAFLSVASKGVGLGFVFQLFYRVFASSLSEWSMLIAILATMTMTVGNVVAIVQENIKRFMAFSSISQAGYFLLGFLGGEADGVPAMLFYFLVYIFSNLAVFAVILFYTNATGKENISDYKGLSRTNPMLALSMLLALFSLAGIPPLSGFMGKLFLFRIAAAVDYYWLVGVAALNATVSLYYYLRIVRQMYMEAPGENASRLPISPLLSSAVFVTTAGAVLLGIFPVVYSAIHGQTGTWMAALWF